MATKIRGAQINDAIAGAGLELTASGILNILVDNSSIEISGDTLQVKSGGITNAMLVNDSVTVTAGVALSGGGEVDLGGTAITLDVSVDGTTISTAGDQLSVIASGIDHGSLADLGADDHTQYILADGTRAFSGIFEAVGMELTEGSVKVLSAPTNSGVSGITASGTTSATFGQVVYLNGSGAYVAAKGDTSSTMPAVAMSTGAGNEVITMGYITEETWNWTPGGLLYVSDATAGDMTQTAPTASGSQVQIVGVAITADTIYFNPDATTVELGDSPFYTKAEVDTLISGSTASGVIDHGTLAGLADDDHLQYVPINGSRQMTADWNIGSYNLGFDVVSPTYPIDIEKTWGVSNAYPSELLIYPTMTGSLTGDIFYTGISVATNSAGWVENGNNASYEGIWVNMAPLTDSYSVKGGTFDATNSNAVVMDTGTAVTANVYNLDASGTLTLGQAVDAYIQNAGSAGTTYLYHGTYNGAGSWTNKWGIHLTGDVKNYLSGTLQLNIPAASSGTGLVLVNDGSIIKSRTIGEIGDEIASSTEHNSLNAIQGGVTTERYHVTDPQHDELSDGFLPDYASTTALSFNQSTRTVTISGTSGAFKYYVKGDEYTTTASSVVIGTDNGVHYVYWGTDGVLTTSTAAWDLSLYAPVATVLWNNTISGGVLSDERHQIVMDWQTHEYLHLTVNTRYGSGFGISGYTVLLDNDSGVTFGMTGGLLYDEDLAINVTVGSGTADFEQPLDDPAQIPIFYRTGAGQWIWDTATDFAFKNTSSGRVNYNNPTGWAQTQCTDFYYVAYFIMGTNNVDFPIISIQGQRQDSTLQNAMDNNSFGSLLLGSMPFAEMKPLYRIIVRSSDSYGGTRKAMIADVDDLRNAGSLPAGAFVATDHGSLSGLGDDDHTQYLLANGTRALSGDLLPNASGTVDLGSAALPYAQIHVDDIYIKGSSLHLGGYTINEFSNDITLADDSSSALPTEYAVKNYTDNLTATLSGDIMQEVSDNYIDNTEMATISGDIMQEVSDNYIDNSEMTTISGDIIDYVDAEVVWEVVDTPTNRIQPKAAHMGLPIYTSGSMTVGGDLTVTGTIFYTDTEQVLVSDNFLYINYGEPGSGVTSVTAGIDIDRGGFPSYVFAFDERNDTFRIGVSGTQDAFNDYPLQPVATREDTPTDTRVPWWDAVSYTFRTQGDTYITINSGTDTISVVAPALFDVGYGSLADENYVTVATEAGDDWVGMGLAGDETYVYLDGSGNRITIQAGDDVEIQSVSGSVYLTGDGSIRLNGGTTSIYVDDDGFWFSGTSSAKVDEILNTIDADSISASSTDKQLATAKLLYNTLSGTVLDGSLTGGTSTYMYYVGANGMPATTGLMTFNSGTEVVHLGEAQGKGIQTFIEVDKAGGLVDIEALSTFSVNTASGTIALTDNVQYFGATNGPRIIATISTDTIQLQSATTDIELTVSSNGMSLKTGADVNEILDSGDSISSASTDDQLATAKLIYDYVNTISGAMVHNELEGLQGGNGSNEYYHLDLTAFTALSGVDGTQVGQWDTAYSHTLSTSNPHSVTYSQVGAIQDSTDTVKDTHIDWGSGANQVDLDDVPDGSSYERVAASQLNSGIYIDASTSIKGIASFSSDNFAVTSGAVTIKDDGVAEPELVIANAPTDGYYLQYTTASGMKWSDVSSEGVLESDYQLDNMSASCDGVETTFYLSYVPVANSLQVYLNGLLQEKGGGKDYTNTTSGVIFAVAPLAGDILLAHYVRTSA